ncbi:hypothetical protein DBZ36_11285 [Alginatibacterium sediminis]|uniref:Thioredoxin domain-containing protein n=1 Tax=Alginatibacterium sediminis TaxID=2164068 RepID=A0A420EB02_9ALTE|nr:tetratricopeptide repeat protein [Alginatibacterium sediminis]RKF17833.1 hypothetical protein DBZ36_11285 [Alginatibacterium sediminis]
MSHAIEITFENAQQVLIEQSFEKPIIAQFYQVGSAACEQLQQQIETIVQRYPEHLVYAKVNMAELAQLAGQLGVTQAPAMIILREGRPTDGFAELPSPQEVQAMLERALPDPSVLKLADVQTAMQQEQYMLAITLCREILEEDPKQSQARFALIKALIETKQASDAQSQLERVPLEDQQSDFQALVSQLQLLIEASDSPEIRELESALQANPDDLDVLQKLAVQYAQAGRNQEALNLLLEQLKSNVNAADGALKASFLDILNTLQGDPIASNYRRSFFSLLY